MPQLINYIDRALKNNINQEKFLADYQLMLFKMQKPSITNIHGLNIYNPGGLYSPDEYSSTKFILDRLHLVSETKKANLSFLEIGCGCGAISIYLDKNDWGWDICATDIDPLAVQTTIQNARINGVNIRCLQSDLFGSINQKFDIILFNIPLFHKQNIETKEIALSSDVYLYVQFMNDAKKHLNPNGIVLFTYASCSDTENLEQPGWNIELQAFDYEGSNHFIRALFKATLID